MGHCVWWFFFFFADETQISCHSCSFGEYCPCVFMSYPPWVQSPRSYTFDAFPPFLLFRLLSSSYINVSLFKMLIVVCKKKKNELNQIKGKPSSFFFVHQVAKLRNSVNPYTRAFFFCGTIRACVLFFFFSRVPCGILKWSSFFFFFYLI